MTRYIVTKKQIEDCVKRGLAEVFKDNSAGTGASTYIYCEIQKALEIVLEDDCEEYHEI